MLFGRDLAELTSGSRALFLEILRRAAYDWALYKTTHRLAQKQIANDAYQWLFEEGPGHPAWKTRIESGAELTSFLAICDMLDLDPERVRAHVRTLTPADVQSGRPALHRKRAVAALDEGDG